MRLWIRSQDKEDLINVDEYLSISETNFSEDIEYVKNPNKRPFFIECSNCILGFYATKERALEILDDIQTRLVNLQMVECEEKGKAREDIRTTHYLECVYEMPKE